MLPDWFCPAVPILILMWVGIVWMASKIGGC